MARKDLKSLVVCVYDIERVSMWMYTSESLLTVILHV